MEHEQIKALGIPERAKNLVDTILLEIQVNGIDSGTHEWCVSMVERTLRAAAPVSVAAGLEMAAKVAEDKAQQWDGPRRDGWYACNDTADAIRALADQHKPSPAEEPMP